MHTGMIWFNNSQTRVEIKIKKAAEYYEKKYGRKPNLCLAHPSILNLPQGQRSTEINGLTVRPYRPVLPGHIWIGIADEGEA